MIKFKIYFSILIQHIIVFSIKPIDSFLKALIYHHKSISENICHWTVLDVEIAGKQNYVCFGFIFCLNYFSYEREHFIDLHLSTF